MSVNFSCPVCECDAPAPPPALPSAPSSRGGGGAPAPQLPINEAFGAFGEDAEVLAALVSNMPLFGAMLLLYCVLHTAFRSVYYLNVVRGTAPPPPPVPTSTVDAVLSTLCCGWAKHVLRMSDDEFASHAGIDAFCFIVFLRLVIRVLFAFGLWAVAVNMTFYVLAMSAEEQPVFLARASIANLASVADGGDWHQWSSLVASVVGMWVCTLYAVWELNRTWRHVIAKCQQSMACADDVSSHTILVRSTDPRNLPQSREDAHRTWEGLYPQQVHTVRMVRNTGALPKKLALLDKLTAQLEALDAAAAATKGTKRAGCGADAAKKAGKVRAKLAATREAVQDLKVRHCGDDADQGLSYFVLFNNRRTCTIARQVVNLPGAAFQVEPAPVPTAVRWEALKPSRERLRAPVALGASALYGATLFFYSIPIGFISLLMNLSELYAVPVVGPVVRIILTELGPTLESFIAALLPTLAQLVFMALLPSLCVYISSYQGHASVGKMQAAAFAKLFTFNFTWNVRVPGVARALLHLIALDCT